MGLLLHGGELARLMLGGERVDDLVERGRAFEHVRELMRGEADAVVGDAVLREVVGADLLGAVAGADLAARGPGALGVVLRLARSRRACARSTFIALALFLCCDFSSCWLTTRPVGRCVIRTAVSVVLTDCPPGPLARNTSMRRSLSSILMSTSSASGSTATVAAEVWMRPCASVAGTRCTRCTPDSNLSRANTPLPVMLAMTSL